MLLGKYYISDHAMQRYAERMDYNKAGVIKAIKRDLRTLNIRQIIRHDDEIHIFTKNCKEFIFTKAKNDTLCLKTFIKRNPIDNILTIEKRKNLVN